MSGIDEQRCDISVCSKCNEDVVTWPLIGKGRGHFNIDLGGSSHLNNTVYLFEGMDFPDIGSIYCYDCAHVYVKGSKMFKSVMNEAKKATITRE